MNRRTFLKVVGATACVVAGGIVGGIKVGNMLNQIESLKAGFAKMLVKRYGKSEGQALMAKILQEFQALFALLPDLGPKEENRWATNMPPAALALATYRVLVPEYANLEEVGQILYKTVQGEMSGVASLIMRVTYNEKANIEKLKLLAARSQRRQYPKDWVMTFIEGTRQDFNYGVDVTECAIQKYLAAQGAPELTRYLCLTDYVSSEAVGRGLVRYKTLAEGCAVCDFRYKEGRPSYLYPLRDGWPPKFANCRA
jgi:hypothetical protein